MTIALAPLIPVVLALAVAGLGLSMSGAPPQVIAAVLSGIFSIYPILNTAYLQQQQQKQPKVDQIDDLVQRKTAILNPLLVFIYSIAFIELIERTVGAIFGVLVGLTLSVDAIPIITPLVVILCLIVAMPFLVVYLAHRSSNSFPWILAAVLLGQLIDVFVGIVFFQVSPVTAILGQIPVLLLLIASCALGYWRAQKTQTTYIMAQLFSNLSANDQATLIDLVRTLPGVAASKPR